jgi:hypothetical protein
MVLSDGARSLAKTFACMSPSSASEEADWVISKFELQPSDVLMAARTFAEMPSEFFSVSTWSILEKKFSLSRYAVLGLGQMPAPDDPAPSDARARPPQEEEEEEEEGEEKLISESEPATKRRKWQTGSGSHPR